MAGPTAGRSQQLIWGQRVGGILGRFQAALAPMLHREGPCSEAAKAESRAPLALTRGDIKSSLNTIKPVTFMARKHGKTIKPAELRMREHCGPRLPTGTDEQIDCYTERRVSQLKIQSSLSPSPEPVQGLHSSLTEASQQPGVSRLSPSSSGPPLSSDANPTPPSAPASHENRPQGLATRT